MSVLFYFIDCLYFSDNYIELAGMSLRSVGLLFSSISKKLTKSFGGVEKRIYICTRRIFKLYIII